MTYKSAICVNYGIQVPDSKLVNLRGFKADEQHVVNDRHAQFYIQLAGTWQLAFFKKRLTILEV